MSAGEATAGQLRAGADSLPNAVLSETTLAAANAKQEALDVGAKLKTETSIPPKDINLSEFGVSSKDKFEPPQELRTHFEGMMRIIADQLRQYQTTGKPLAENQKKFLAVYEKLGIKMFDSANGWSLANLVIEQEMFLRIAAIGQDMVHRLSGYSRKDGKISLTTDEARGLVNQYGPEVIKAVLKFNPVSLPFTGIFKFIESAFKHEKATIEFDNFEIQIGTLPQEYQDYIAYINPNINIEKTKTFLVDVQRARIGVDVERGEKKVGFYQSLGMDPKDLMAVTPWERFGIILPISPIGARIHEIGDINKVGEGIETEWMRIRHKFLQEAAGGIVVAAIPRTKVPEVFFEAQQKTIDHFLNLHLQAIAEAKFGDTSEENGTIKTLENRILSMKSPQEAAKMKTKTEAEKTQLQATINEQETRLNTIQEALRTKKETRTTLVATKDLDEKERDFWKNIVQKQTVERNAYIQQRNTLEADFNTKINDPTIAVDIKTQLITLKGQQVNAYNERIAEAQKRINEATSKLIEAKKQLIKLPTIDEEMRLLEGVTAAPPAPAVMGEIAKLQAEIAKNKRTLQRKQTILEKGVETAVQTKIDQVEAMVGCLQDYDRVVSSPLFHPVEKMLTVQDLTSIAVKNEGATNYPEGYLRFMDHLFQYTNKEKRTESFKTSTALLSPKELGIILRDRFGLINAAGAPLQVIADSDLQAVFSAMTTRNVSQTRIASVFLNVLEFIDEKGKKFE